MRDLPDPRMLLRAMFDAAVAAAQPDTVLAPHLPEPPRGRTVVLGAGKAAAAMARAVEMAWPGSLSGLVVTAAGAEVPCARIEVVAAAHPVPDQAGMLAARRMLDLARSLGPDDLALCLVSGGGSALLSLPPPGISLADVQLTTRALLASGAPIREINIVRRHLSAINGGRLAAACAPARVCTLAISDVPGDDPVDIASGPTVPDPSSCSDALAVLRRYSIAAAASVVAALETGACESIKPGDSRTRNPDYRLVATPRSALDAAAAVAERAGVAGLILGDAIEGEAREIGATMAEIARNVAAHGQPIAAPCVLLSSGETTVTVRGRGRGGRNVEFVLAFAVAADGLPRCHALAADTDGIDGNEAVAGAIVGPDTLARAAQQGLHAQACLDNNDAHTFFAALGDQVITGPTRTNVNDFRAILVWPKE